MAIPSLATYGGTLLQPGYPGQIAEGGPTVIRTGINDQATAVDFGQIVVRSTATAFGATDKIKAYSAGADIPCGISVRNASPLIAPAAGGNNSVLYAQNTPVPFVTFGVVVCTAAENVTEGDAAVGVVATPLTVGGTTGGAGNGTTRTAFPNAIWLDTVTSGGVGRVRVNMTTT